MRMSNDNIRREPFFRKDNPRPSKRPKARYVSCCLIENLLDQYGPDHPERVGRVDLTPFIERNENV